MDELYTFVYRGLLTDESLDKAGRRSRPLFGQAEADSTRAALSLDLLDNDRIADAEKMAIIYTAIHAFENSVRHFVSGAMAEKHEENWWDAVPERVRKRAATRMEDESKFGDYIRD